MLRSSKYHRTAILKCNLNFSSYFIGALIILITLLTKLTCDIQLSLRKKLIVEDKTKVQLIQNNLAQLTNRKYPCLTSASSNVYACITRLLKYSKESSDKDTETAQEDQKAQPAADLTRVPEHFPKKGKIVLHILACDSSGQYFRGGYTIPQFILKIVVTIRNCQMLEDWFRDPKFYRDGL